MNQHYLHLVHRLREAVLGRSGATDLSVRQSVLARAARIGGDSLAQDTVPIALTTFVDKVAQHAFKVSNEDVEALRHAGYSEEAIFEIMASAALGAGLGRLERGLAALRGEV